MDAIPPLDGLSPLPPGFALLYSLELLYDHAPVFNAQALRDRLTHIGPLNVTGNEWSIEVVHLNHLVAMKGAQMPSMTRIIRWNRPLPHPDLAKSLSQTWDWDAAEAALNRCEDMVVVSDVIGSGLDYHDRYHLISAVAVAFADLTAPAACHWRPAGCLIDPKVLGKRLEAKCNVRRFRDEGKSESMVMDTLGLAALGLPDLQCKFSKRDPGRMAAWMYAVGEYIFENDDVLEDGDTVDGALPGDRWTCRHQPAVAAPERIVLDIRAESPPSVQS